MKTIVPYVLALVIIQNELLAQTSRASADSITICFPFSPGWSMFSNPVYRSPGTDSVCQIWPSIFSCCVFGFTDSSGYQCRYTVPNGMGFWTKMPLGCISGEPITQDSIPVVSGWNMIGSISYSIPTDSITSIPPGIIVSGFFHHRAEYVVADTIRPGWGYWVKSSQTGWLVVSATVSPE